MATLKAKGTIWSYQYGIRVTVFAPMCRYDAATGKHGLAPLNSAKTLGRDAFLECLGRAACNSGLGARRQH